MDRFTKVVLNMLKAAVALFALLISVPALAGTTYYVDNRAGSGCNDAGAGTSPSAPWCGFSRPNGRIFVAGDALLLARGATWNEQLTLNGQGSPAEYVSVGAYGSGDRPRIFRNGSASERAIRMNNPSYWRVSDIEVGFAGAGILVYFDSILHEGLEFNNILAHDIRGIYQGNRFSGGNINCTTTDKIWNSAGIIFTGAVTMSPTQYAVRKITISNVEGTANQSSISFDWCNGSSSGIVGAERLEDVTVQDVVMKNLYLYNDDGPAAGCDEGMRLVNMRNAVLMNSRLINEAACASATGTIAVILGRLRNSTLVNNIISNVPDTGSPDQGGVDFEFGVDNVNIRNNYIADNAGPGIEFLAIYPPSNSITNNVVSGNTLVNNGIARRGSYLGGINQTGSQVVPTGTIINNFAFEPTGFLTTGSGGTFGGFAITNNIEVSSRANLYNAPSLFSNVQGGNSWSYQTTTNGGGSWNNMNFDAAASAWRDGPAFASQFEQHPGVIPNGWTARTWTAPTAGVISIRGRVLKSDAGGGDGISARITRNGAILWGPQSVAANDISGFDTNLDSLAVVTGDVVRFEVGNGGTGNNAYDSTSWAPTLAYVSGGGSPFWGFEADLQGWSLVNQVSGTVSGGFLNLTATGPDPFIHSPASLQFDSSALKTVTLRMRQGTPSATAQLFFTTTADGGWNEAKSIRLRIIPSDPNYTTYLADMSSVATWTGTISQLRVDPSEAAGSISIDYIKVGTAARRWNFDSGLDSWALVNQMSGSASGGVLTVNASGSDPYMVSPDNLGIAAASSRSVSVRMRNSTTSNVGEFFFTTTSDPNFTSAKRASFVITAQDSDYTTYTAEMAQVPGWTGIVKQIRLDPATAGGTINIDYIQIN